MTSTPMRSNNHYVIAGICYNESRFIRHFIEHHAPRCSKIILLDTGSTDDTVRIISEYPAVALFTMDKPKIQNFAYLRNVLMKRIYELELTEDFVLILDLDELLLSEPLISAISSCCPNINIQRFEPQVPNNITEIARLFSTRIPGTWVGVIHEGFVYDDRSISNIPTSPFLLSVVHLKSEQLQTNKKRETYVRLITQEINSGNFANYLYFGLIYALRENNAELIKKYYFSYYLLPEGDGDDNSGHSPHNFFFLNDLILLTIAKYSVLSGDTETYDSIITKLTEPLKEKLKTYCYLIETPYFGEPPGKEFDFLGTPATITIAFSRPISPEIRQALSEICNKLIKYGIVGTPTCSDTSLTIATNNDLKFSRHFFGPAFRVEVANLNRACYRSNTQKQITSSTPQETTPHEQPRKI